MGNICVKYFKFRLVVQEMQLKEFFSILKLDQQSRRRCWLYLFSVFTSGGHFVQ